MIRLIIWVIVGLLALSFFGISLRGLVENPTNMDNVSFIWNLFLQGWNFVKDWFMGIVDFFRDLIG